MRFDDDHDSPDIIDRRGETYGGGGGGGFMLLLSLVLRSRFGWVGAVVLVGGYLALGGLQRLTGPTPVARKAPAGAGTAGAIDAQRAFVGTVLDDAQDTWTVLFEQRRKRYVRAKLVLFSGKTKSACGLGDAAIGPFYCPADQRVYIDLSFYDALHRELGAPGDFAQAYVIAHEIGHHVQNLRGDTTRVHRAPKSEQKGATGLSVRLELQADCFAGIWAHGTRKRDLLEKGDIDEALTAAAAIGDDRLQRRAGGEVQPESFSHGTSAQRARWFRRGLERGDIDACDTFAAASL
ncbi:MAG: neutral zinc metallopeptidase [Myxococcota bacterium]